MRARALFKQEQEAWRDMDLEDPAFWDDPLELAEPGCPQDFMPELPVAWFRVETWISFWRMHRALRRCAREVHRHMRQERREARRHMRQGL